MYLIAEDLKDMTTDANFKVTLEAAEEAQRHPDVILRQFVLAARASGHATSAKLPQLLDRLQ